MNTFPLAYEFERIFNEKPTRQFAAPGRTEIGGNHTDHQHGCVLAGAVDLLTRAAVLEKEGTVVRLQSEGFGMTTVDIADLTPKKEEEGTTAALIRGVAAGLQAKGIRLVAFDAFVTSQVLSGSGLSSSAAFEVLVGNIFAGLAGAEIDAVEIAKIGQYAENVFFGKPCGLMDQMASSVGGLVFIDFNDPKKPYIEKIDYDFYENGYALFIIDTNASHADLTGDYAAIPTEMKAVAKCFGKEVLRDVREDDFYDSLARVRSDCGDRAVLRAMHFFEENKRARVEADCLKNDDIKGFLREVNASGESSWKYLQNIVPAGRTEKQEIAYALAAARHFLGLDGPNGKGAVRVHGGGFAGTIQAFVPVEYVSEFASYMEECLGFECCLVLQVLPDGGREESLDTER